MRFCLLFFLGVLVFLGASLEAQAKRVLVVAMGGYRSCGNSSVIKGKSPYGMGMYKSIQGLLKQVVSHDDENEPIRVDSILTCLESNAPPNGSAAIVTSANPKKVRWRPAKKIAEEIESFVDDETAVFLIGHSYGGWLGMYLSERLDSDVNLVGLFTIDPISARHCGPMEVIFGSKDCHQAPRDLDNAFISKQVGHWLNFFQNQDTWLTSSSIPEAENFHIRYRDRSHTAIDQDKRVWTEIETEISQRLRG